MICSIDGCNKNVLAKKLCSMHYWRLTTKGTTESKGRMLPIKDRFWAKVDRRGDNECWEWKGQIAGGYGKFRSHVGQLAHRYSWVIHNREFKEHETYDNKYVIMHSCDNSKCVNPKHLSLGTSKLNAKDRDQKGRHVFIPRLGEDNPNAKITSETAKNIYQAKGSHSEASEHFNVSIHTVSSIRNKRTWVSFTEGLKRNTYELC